MLRRAGIEEADAVVVSTDGDNTNIVVGQVVQKRFGVECVVVRILDPARAEFYASQGMRTFCPTSTRDRRADRGRPRLRGPAAGRGLMYVLVAGGGQDRREPRAQPAARSATR